MTENCYNSKTQSGSDQFDSDDVSDDEWFAEMTEC